MWVKMISSISLDFHKALDISFHSGLLNKLNNHGIGRNGLEWINKWLKFRKQGKNKWSPKVTTAL